MKEKWTKNLGMKILSLGFAFVLWLVIINVDNPVITKEFRNIPVTLLNESAIKSRNQVYEIVSGDTVDITVRGKRSNVEALRPSDVGAVADLSDLSITYSVPITPRFTTSVSGNMELSLGDVQTLKVLLEDVATEQFKITTSYKGSVEEGYTVADVKAKPNIITVSGAKTQIDKIDQIRAEIDVSNASGDIEDSKVVPKVYDASGKQIDSKKFTFVGTEFITVTAKIYKTKDIYLNIQVTGEPAYGYQYVKYDLIPKTIKVAGEQDVISKISTLDIKIDINGADGDRSETINVLDYLPDGVMLADENSTAEVNITISKLQSKEITFSVDDIEIQNLPDDWEFYFANPTTELTVKVLGLDEQLKDVTSANLKPYIDVADMEAGLHDVELKFHVTNVNVTIVNYPRLMINLAKSEDEEEETVPDEGTDEADSNDNKETNAEDLQTDEETDTTPGE